MNNLQLNYDNLMNEYNDKNILNSQKENELLSENEENDTIISIVFNADCRSNLYLLMSEILSNYCV